MYGNGALFRLKKIMKNKICYIVCAGENKGIFINANPCNYVIAADGGLNYLKELNISPNLIVGDFDSANQPNCECEIIKLKVDKCETDTFVCVEEGIKRGYRDFYIYCGTGGRIDHTIANLQTLIYLSKKDYRGYLFDGDQVITVISNNSTLEFSAEALGGVSVFALNGDAHGITISGLKYTLNNSILTADFPLGVSNSFVGKDSKIECGEGFLAIVFPSNAIKYLK